MIEVRDYIDAKGRIPFRDWVTKLDTIAKVRVLIAVLRMEQGDFSAAKSVGAGVSELRLDFAGLPGLLRKGWRDAGDTARRRNEEAATDRHRSTHALWAEYKRRKREE